METGATSTDTTVGGGEQGSSRQGSSATDASDSDSPSISRDATARRH